MPEDESSELQIEASSFEEFHLNSQLHVLRDTEQQTIEKCLDLHALLFFKKLKSLETSAFIIKIPIEHTGLLVDLWWASMRKMN